MASWLVRSLTGVTERLKAAVVGPEVAPDLAGVLMNAVEGLDPYDDQDPETFRKAYKEMVHEPVVKAALYTKVFEVCALDLRVVPADDDPQSREVAECVEHGLETVKGGVRGMLAKTLFPALKYQYSISEVNLRLEQRGRFSGKYVVDAVKSKNIRDGAWEFELDAFKNVIGLVHTSQEGRRVYEPQKFLHYRFLPEFENPRGVSDLRAAYRSWWVKQVIQRAMAVFGEKMGPAAVASYENAVNVPKLEAQMQKFHARRWAVVPKDVQLQVLDYMSTGALQGYKQILDYLDKQVFLGIRGAFLQALEGDRTGARSMGEVHESTADLFVWYLSVDVVDALNDQVVPLLVDLNYGPATERPRVMLEAPVQEDIEVLTRIAKGAQDVGLALSKKELYERFGFKPPEDEDDALEKSAAPAPLPFGLEDKGESFDDLLRGDGAEGEPPDADGALPAGVKAPAGGDAEGDGDDEPLDAE